MELNSIISAILAGGLAGQITTLILQNRATRNREFNNWLRNERFKVFSNFISLTSSEISCSDLSMWPDQIRISSQSVHLLFDNGEAPKDVSEGMQKLYSLALSKKLGQVENENEWKKSFREEVRKLRKGFSTVLHKTF